MRVPLEIKTLVRKNIDENEHDRLSNITIKTIQSKGTSLHSAFRAALHCTVTIGSSTMNIIHTLK